MSNQTIEQRLTEIEARLARIEQAQGLGRPAPAASPADAAMKAATLTPKAPAPKPAATPARDEHSAGNFLGVGGAIAFLLAASYLVQLAIDSGWLTPLRQVGLAALLGLSLISAGFVLRKSAQGYAGLLPAAGIAVLFLATYGAHLYHGIIGTTEAGVAVIIVCAMALWLCRLFGSDLYALMAVAGSYSAPFLLATGNGTMTDLALYFFSWSIVYCVFALWHGNRAIYLVALYLALIGFDIAWQMQGQGQGGAQWGMTLLFQSGQFALFAATTALFSVRHGQPLDHNAGVAHLPPLLLFYALQYHVLSQHLPAWAPWIAIATLAVVAVLTMAVRARLGGPQAGGQFLLWSYAAVVLFHAGYLESVPDAWAPWVALLAVGVFGLFTLRQGGGLGARWPVGLALAAMFAINFLRVCVGTDLQSVPGAPLLPLANALLLYLGYAFCRNTSADRIKGALLYLGHLSAMIAVLRLVHSPMLASVLWAVIAMAAMALSFLLRERLLRTSSLQLFGITAAKVMLYDLSGASSGSRVVGLLVLGSIFFFGGMLYRKMVKD
jgi:uncharacterized membrane protein